MAGAPPSNSNTILITFIIMVIVACTPGVIFLTKFFLLNRARRTTTALDASPTAKLGEAKKAAALVSFGVRGGAASAGWFLMTFGLASNVAGFGFIPGWPINIMTSMIPWPPGGTLLLLAVRPTDKTAITVATCVLSFIQFFFFFGGFQFSPPIQRNVAGEPYPAYWLFPLFSIINLSCFISNMWNCCCGGCCCPSKTNPPSGREQLARLWRSFRIFAVSMAGFFGLVALGSFRAFGPPPPIAPGVPPYPGWLPDDGPGALTTSVLLLCVATFMKPAMRRRFHMVLGGIAAKGEARAAAAVAGLVGGRSPDEALKHGITTFRGLPLTSLSETDFASSGDTGLHQKTVKADLGQVHAFLSHSWHDAADAKWQAITKWGEGFKASSPLLWLDKACIDQNNIDSSLAALPVYLSGCRDLLVVVGPTYTSRLWCVMELFVFLQMGGSIDRVNALVLGGKNVERELATFDAAKAQCFKQEDRDRLLGIIESAFGDFTTFNGKVRGLFAKRGSTLQLKVDTDNKQRPSSSSEVTVTMAGDVTLVA